MFETIAAIDIGTHTIKVVTIRTGLRDFQLKSLTYENINPAAEDWTTAMKDALDRVLKEEDLTGMRVITNLPMEQAIIRNITFPFSDPEKIAEAIPFEAEDNIPFKREDLILDFQPLKSLNEGEGRVLMAATHKSNIQTLSSALSEIGVNPVRMGLEANALYECYRYFNTVEGEAVIQLDIGDSKTIINVIENNKLLYTRCIALGVAEVHKVAAGVMKISRGEAITLIEQLDLDLLSIESNVEKGHFKTLGLSRQQLKKIYDGAVDVAQELIEQIFITTRAFYQDYAPLSFNRVLISGGGANITGLGTILSKELDAPVVSLPFIEGYEDRTIRTHFPIAFGTLLSFIHNRRSSVNFLKGEFLPDMAGETRKIYYLSGALAALTVLVLVFKLLTSMVFMTRSNSYYTKLMNDKFKTYFPREELTDDPLAAAKKILKKKKKEYESMATLSSEDTSTLQLLSDIFQQWTPDDSFDLSNVTVNESVVRIDGVASSSRLIDEFKRKLIQTGQFENVSMQNRYSTKNEVPFTLTIKKKLMQKDNQPKMGMQQ